MTETYDILSENTQSTVVAEYERPMMARETEYQSESDLEIDLINRLQRQGYEYLQIHSEEELIANLRKQLEKLNDITFTDSEWQRFFKAEIAKESNGIKEKAFTIGIGWVPSEDSINRKQNRFSGRFPEWTFTDCDTTEANRRINVGKRFLNVYRGLL